MHTTLIDCKTLNDHLDDSGWVIVDCRFSLSDTELGSREYRLAHIPGAVYAHLDQDLSGPPITDHGRHPLPTPVAMSVLFSRLGISEMSQVVVYDSLNGGIASRLWWMLRYMGHMGAAVLDGGWQAWVEEGFSTREGEERNASVQFSGYPRSKWLVRLEEVDQLPLLVDSRAADRYRGENETIDKAAGHIPGSVNYCYQNNWSENGRYLPPDQIRDQFKDLLGKTSPEKATFLCGSGVTACANLLAMAHAGLGDGRLFVGSWSEWSSDPERPVATGEG